MPVNSLNVQVFSDAVSGATVLVVALATAFLLVRFLQLALAKVFVRTLFALTALAWRRWIGVPTIRRMLAAGSLPERGVMESATRGIDNYLGWAEKHLDALVSAKKPLARALLRDSQVKLEAQIVERSVYMKRLRSEFSLLEAATPWKPSVMERGVLNVLESPEVQLPAGDQLFIVKLALEDGDLSTRSLANFFVRQQVKGPEQARVFLQFIGDKTATASGLDEFLKENLQKSDEDPNATLGVSRESSTSSA
jgi:hypothetical protein